ncbi:hypothetical protein EGW08_012082 [Elysia chlorotica]|uniref:Protein xylosyltransferase n=1 Tax=Elysia chlorotica TaxID=188477 RepID=A0A433TF66_ELYCH|nr:hypothetical protein EGW08_012082 [Elysia chlorotica]
MTPTSIESIKGGGWCRCQSTATKSFYWKILAGFTFVSFFLSYTVYTSQIRGPGSYAISSFPGKESIQGTSKNSKPRAPSDTWITPALKSLSPRQNPSKNEIPTFNPRLPSEFFNTLSGHYVQTIVNCSAVLSGNQTETKRAEQIAKQLAEEERSAGESFNTPQRKEHYNTLSETVLKLSTKSLSQDFARLTTQWYLNATKDCAWFKQTRGYITSSLTQEEEEFPIAFSMLVFKDLEMVERLLRMVYRPQNYYCIHVDSKSPPDFYAAVKSLAACFPHSVRMSSRRVDVQWGTFTVLEPELICMQDLWEVDQNTTSSRDTAGSQPDSSQRSSSGGNRSKWKYFINLTGQEFPLKTNYEIVQILKAFNGANSEEGTIKRANRHRWKTSPPHGIVPVKGGVHTVLNRFTIDYILHNDTARDFIEWLKTTSIPDETFFASLNYNPQLGIPGTYNGESMETVPTLARYKMWYGHNCHSGQTVRAICILSTGDLPRLGRAPELFANKFYLHQDRVVIGCLEEMLFNNTRDETLGTKAFKTTFYENQDFVKNQVPIH